MHTKFLHELEHHSSNMDFPGHPQRHIPVEVSNMHLQLPRAISVTAIGHPDPVQRHPAEQVRVRGGTRIVMNWSKSPNSQNTQKETYEANACKASKTNFDNLGLILLEHETSQVVEMNFVQMNDCNCASIQR